MYCENTCIGCMDFFFFLQGEVEKLLISKQNVVLLHKLISHLRVMKARGQRFHSIKDVQLLRMVESLFFFSRNALVWAFLNSVVITLMVESNFFLHHCWTWCVNFSTWSSTTLHFPSGLPIASGTFVPNFNDQIMIQPSRTVIQNSNRCLQSLFFWLGLWNFVENPQFYISQSIDKCISLSS